ncbi:MAG: signal peptidase I [Candidatus Zambryskibacteria bacterium]|nr:signal peptidase I [Candidatus Zambryskibacteria bacterium]
MTKNNFWSELFKLVIISLVIIIPFRLYIAKPFIVSGASMDPTFETGDYLIVDELTYYFRAPERGSVLIFKYPLDPSKSFIKRVIGLPEETVELKDGKIKIINAEHPEGFIFEEPYVKFKKNDDLSYKLKAGEYFVMGDNRAGSADSRLWGPVPTRDIVGRPIIRFFPPALLPGDHSKDFNNLDKQN